MAGGQVEIQQLYRSLESLVSQALETGGSLPEAERLEIFRLLHSIKSWAGFEHLAALEAACHGMEDLVRQRSSLDRHDIIELAAGLIVVAGELGGKASMEVGSQAAMGKADPTSASVWKLHAPHPVFSERELRLIQSLRIEGRSLHCCRVWISPEEALPLTRILVLHTRFEELGLVRAELWLAQDGLTQGPFAPGDWLGAGLQDQDGECQGAWYRCYYGQVADGDEAVIELDQTEAIIDTAMPESGSTFSDFQACAITQIELTRLQAAAQSMLGHYSTLTGAGMIPGLMADLAASPVSGWLRAALERWQPLARELAPDGEDIRWQLYDEGQRLPGFALSVLDEISRQFLRNSLAHGLEKSALRLSAGKPEAMRIAIGFVQDGQAIRYQYDDDGAGLDLERLAGIAGGDPGDLSQPERLLELICRPEFSSADPEGLHAGRGMGLNLVAQLAGPVLGGTLSLVNRPGLGLTFTIQLRRDLTELAVQLFRLPDGLWAIPQVQVAGVIDNDPQMVRHDRSGQAFLGYAGQQIPLRLSGDGQGSAGSLLVLLQQGSGLVQAIACERYVGSEKVLVTPPASRVYSRIARDWTRLWSMAEHGVWPQ